MLTVENGDLKCNCLTLAKGIAEREKKIDKLEKKLTSDGILPLNSWVKSLVESKEELKERLRMTSIENEDLADECIGLAKVVEVKTNEVEVLEERVKYLENEKQSFIEAKEEGYSSLVQELFKEIELLSEKVKMMGKEHEMLSTNALKLKNELNNEKSKVKEVQSSKYVKLARENEDLKEKNGELKELVEFLEMERKCVIDERTESSQVEENQKRLFKNDNAKLKEQIQAWSKGFAMMKKKGGKLVAELDLWKNRCEKVSSLAKKEVAKRKSMKKKWKRAEKKIRMMKEICKERKRYVLERELSIVNANAQGLASPQVAYSELEAKNLIARKEFLYKREVSELKDTNNELVALVDFLEMERMCTLEEIEEMKTEIEELRINENLKSELEEQIKDLEEKWQSVAMGNEEMNLKFELLRKDFDSEILERMDLEKSAEQIEIKYKCMKVKLDNELQKNINLEMNIMKLEETIENVNKSSLNCFQKIFRRR